MQFSTISAAFLALAATALAQTAGFNPISKPSTGEIVNAGSTYTIVWQSTVTGKITISLIGGETPATLQEVGTIATGVESSTGQFAWKVDSTLGKDKTYGIKISLDSNPATFQFGFPFAIKAAGSSSSSSVASSSSTTALSTGYPTSSTTHSAASSAVPTSAASSYTSYPASSYPVSSYPATSSPSAKSTTSYYSFSTISSAGNLSSTTRGPTTVTTIATTTLSTSASRTTTSAVQTAAATHVVAGSLALVGGIAAAIFAL